MEIFVKHKNISWNYILLVCEWKVETEHMLAMGYTNPL